MNAIIDFLSGEVPGGLLLLCLILLIINLSLFFFYKGSKFFTKEVYRSKVIKSNLFIIVIYVTIWIVLRPTPLPDSILFLPAQNGKKCEFTISEILEKNTSDNLSENYRLHEWEWFYQTCIKDSINDYNYRLSIAKRLHIDLIVTGRFLNESKIKISVIQNKSIVSQEFVIDSENGLIMKVLNWLDQKFQILKNNKIENTVYINDNLKKIITAKRLYYNGDYKQALKLINDLQPQEVILKSKILFELGKVELSKIKKSEFEKKQNINFAKAYNLLIPIAKEGNDNAKINRILGEIYLFEKKYKNAEIFLKRALTQNPYDARIYNDLYFLHFDRYKDIGFKNRFEILQKAIELDNGFTDAVFNLADDYFQSGTGIKSGTGTTFALETLNNYMKINGENEKILNLLASINLKIKHTDQAIRIYNKLIERDKTNSLYYYNLGIGYFHKGKYKKAEEAFFKSIEIDEYPDSYLYIGAINKIIGNYEKALFYYRERIKRRKKGEDDYYATEALHGLQWILKKQYEDSVNRANKVTSGDSIHQN